MSIPVLYDACVLYGNEVRDPADAHRDLRNGQSALDR
jgi:hypothetical protein